MYNRGRGTAYYDLIYKKKEPLYHILRIITYIIIFSALIMLDSTAAIIIIIMQLSSLVNDGLKISQASEKQKTRIILMHILNCGVRSIGYNVNMIKHIKKG